jgi:hypothetical protein
MRAWRVRKWAGLDCWAAENVQEDHGAVFASWEAAYAFADREARR